MKENNVIEEKAEFISDNKAYLLDNLSIIKCDLFNILVKDEPLSTLKEYNHICENIKKINSDVNYQLMDELYLIFSINSFLEKIPISLEMKESYQQKLFLYVEYFEQKKKDKELLKLKQYGYCR